MVSGFWNRPKSPKFSVKWSLSILSPENRERCYTKERHLAIWKNWCFWSIIPIEVLKNWSKFLFQFLLENWEDSFCREFGAYVWIQNRTFFGKETQTLFAFELKITNSNHAFRPTKILFLGPFFQTNKTFFIHSCIMMAEIHI